MQTVEYDAVRWEPYLMDAYRAARFLRGTKTVLLLVCSAEATEDLLVREARQDGFHLVRVDTAAVESGDQPQ